MINKFPFQFHLRTTGQNNQMRGKSSGLDSVIIVHIKNNSELLGFELDVHWIQRAGVNPLEIIKAYEGRVNILHLKDYRIGAMDMEAFKTGDMKQIFASFMNTVEFAELGEGNLDFKAIIDTGIKAGVKHFFIEQDMSYGKDPLESLKISRDHLVDIGYEHLF